MEFRRRETLFGERSHAMKKKRAFEPTSAFLAFFGILQEFLERVTRHVDDSEDIPTKNGMFSIDTVCKAIRLYMRRHRLTAGEFLSIGICDAELQRIFRCRWFAMSQLPSMVAKHMLPVTRRLDMDVPPWPETVICPSLWAEPGRVHIHPTMGLVYDSREVHVPAYYSEMTAYPNCAKLPFYIIKREIVHRIAEKLDQFSDSANRAVLCLEDDPLEKVLKKKYLQRWELTETIIQVVADQNEPEGLEDMTLL